MNESREERRELGEHLEIAGRDLLADFADRGARDVENVEIDLEPEQRRDALLEPRELPLELPFVPEGLRNFARNFLTANRLTGRFRCPSGE
jgi:hypothetical protein